MIQRSRSIRREDSPRSRHLQIAADSWADLRDHPAHGFCRSCVSETASRGRNCATVDLSDASATRESRQEHLYRPHGDSTKQVHQARRLIPEMGPADPSAADSLADPSARVLSVLGFTHSVAGSELRYMTPAVAWIVQEDCSTLPTWMSHDLSFDSVPRG